MRKFYSKFNISSISSLKFTKSTAWNSICGGISNSMPQLLGKFNFDLIEFSMTKIFKIQ